MQEIWYRYLEYDVLFNQQLQTLILDKFLISKTFIQFRKTLLGQLSQLKDALKRFPFYAGYVINLKKHMKQTCPLVIPSQFYVNVEPHSWTDVSILLNILKTGNLLICEEFRVDWCWICFAAKNVVYSWKLLVLQKLKLVLIKNCQLSVFKLALFTKRGKN